MKYILQQRDNNVLNLEIAPIGKLHMVKFETMISNSEKKNQNWPFSKIEMYLTEQELENLFIVISNYIQHGE